ncbi:MAG: protein of unknown function DUF485 [uncultured Nocardioidaceae bacterium]|uniref:DUF485 domain-containing protein n=1 Tax=uncultured Nocardioidaceae bacterium TaxID=253824 RepID=A0A6J4LVR8_9ACTN|nr:MAG: protein of unknown function DUF485 [uncultured Nocardioidaceae bacterium]
MPATASTGNESHASYERIAASEDFALLRKRHRSFAIPATLAFMAWYLLYVLLSSFAGDFMSAKVVGNINVALIFGVLQFVTTFLIAYLYSRYSNKQLDPLAGRLQAQYDDAVRPAGEAR